MIVPESMPFLLLSLCGLLGTLVFAFAWLRERQKRKREQQCRQALNTGVEQALAILAQDREEREAWLGKDLAD